ncbi:MAG: hypothetical protein EXR79_16805 [Myxococcales bacterium]|nr:hypothetical protein [Myxococcales bacterium]
MAPDRATHTDLTADCVYGPVPSRRYGTTLGLNLLPVDEKHCTLRCTYCQLGGENPRKSKTFPPIAQYARELGAALQALAATGTLRGHAIDALVFSGNGDATMHPDLTAAVDVTLALRERWAPGVPIVLLTGGTELVRADVRQAVARLDEVAVKVDAGSQQVFERLDMPWRPIALADIVAAASELPNAVVQTLLVQGSVDNTTPAEIDLWLGHLRTARPLRADVHTLDRPPIEKKLRKVPAVVLEAVAARARAEAGVACRTFAGGLDD